MLDRDKEDITILVVEDLPVDANFVETELKALWPKAQIIVIQSFAEIAKQLKKFPVDFILLDLNLPDSLGAKTVERVRALDREIPIIVLTGFQSEFIIKSCLSLGATEVILKSEIKDGHFKQILQLLC